LIVSTDAPPVYAKSIVLSSPCPKQLAVAAALVSLYVPSLFVTVISPFEYWQPPIDNVTGPATSIAIVLPALKIEPWSAPLYPKPF